MRSPILHARIGLAAVASLALLAAPAAASAAPPTEPLRITAGQPDLNAGLDLKRFGTDDAYMESLSATAATLSSVAAEIRTATGNDPDLVEFGNMTAANTLVVYWSGPSDAAALTTVKQLADRAGVTVVVAPRTVTRAQIEAATDRTEANVASLKRQGIAVAAYGGFAADFDGVKVNIDPAASKAQNLSAVRSSLESALDVPVQVARAAAANTAGRYNDTQPYNAGGLMVSNDNHICSSGFGVTLGASKHRYLSARHCNAGPYFTDNGGEAMGDIQLTGTGFNGSAVFGAQGSSLVFDGTNDPANTSIRALTQRDPALSTVGTPVCNEGANSGQRCGTIAQVALNYNDGFGTLRVNYVTSPNGQMISAQGDSGGPIISLHTQSRAWAVGIMQAHQEPYSTGAVCGLHYAGNNRCAPNFFFNNIDYAMDGFTGYGIRYS